MISHDGRFGFNFNASKTEIPSRAGAKPTFKHPWFSNQDQERQIRTPEPWSSPSKYPNRTSIPSNRLLKEERGLVLHREKPIDWCLTTHGNHKSRRVASTKDVCSCFNNIYNTHYLFTIIYVIHINHVRVTSYVLFTRSVQ